MTEKGSKLRIEISAKRKGREFLSVFVKLITLFLFLMFNFIYISFCKIRIT